MVDVIAGLAAVSQALSVAKELREIDAAINKADLKLKVADLTGALADAQQALVDVQGLLAEKNKEIDRLKVIFERTRKTVEYDGFLFELNENELPSGYPFCPRCFEIDRVMIKVVRHPKSATYTLCPQCKNIFKVHRAEHNGILRPDLKTGS